MDKKSFKDYVLKNYKEKTPTQMAQEIKGEFNPPYENIDALRRRISAIVCRVERKEKPVEEAEEELVPLELKENKYYIITWQQNNTNIHPQLWENILAYKEFLGAEVAVILGRYIGSGVRSNDIKWSPETKQYWDFTRHDIHKYVNILSDIRVQPTAEYPLSGLEQISRDKTSILGHPKRHMKCIPVLEGAPPKALATTMALSVPNYTNTKAGKKADFSHKFGFILIEINDDEVFHMRQVEAEEDGSFIDLFYEIKNGKVFNNHFAKAIVWGDIHLGETDPNVVKSTYKLISTLNIPTSVFHDLIDGTSVNNHTLDNPIERYKTMEKGYDDVMAELESAKFFLKSVPTDENIVVHSNHDNRFDRWIVSTNWKNDLKNSLAYLELAQIALTSKNDKGIFANILDSTPELQGRIKTLGPCDSYRIGGIECAHHGHLGVNGSRGSLIQYKKMNVQTITGHSHSPGVIDDSYAVGTSTFLRLGYNNGASDWYQSHCLIHKNNKIQHIMFSKGKYTTFKTT